MIRRAAGSRGSLALAVAVAVMLVVAGLLVAGLQTIPVRTFALRVPDASPVALVAAGHPACEGPIETSVAARSVGIFGTNQSGEPVVRVTVSVARGGATARGRAIARGQERREGGSLEHLVALDHPIPPRTPVRVCVRSSSGTFSLRGTGTLVPGVRASGVTKGAQFSLVLTRPGTFLGSLGTGFSRAGIFKPSWVGAWTFWVLLALLALTPVGVVLAVTRAGAADAERTSDGDGPRAE